MKEILVTKELSRNFGGVKALCGLSIKVDKGLITALIGPNGAGKTTAFNLITGVFPPTCGKVEFHGRDITGYQPHKIASMGIARTFQNIRIFPNMTVAENVMVGMHSHYKSGFFSAALGLPSVRGEEKIIRDKVSIYLDFVKLGKFSDIEAGNLSFGFQRLLEIARALAMNPEILLLDEPAAGLNSQETSVLGELIKKIRDGGVTVLLVEHDMDLVMGVSDNVIVLNNGCFVTEGTPSEVQRNQEVIKAYLGES